MKKIINFAVVTLVFITILSVNVFASPKVVTDNSLYINGKAQTFENPILNIEGRNFYPMREVLNKLGIPNSQIYWESAKKGDKTVTFDDFKKISFTANKNTYGYNFEFTHKMDTAPIIYKNMMYLPIKYVAEANRFNLDYDSKTKTTYILTKQSDFPLSKKENLFNDFVNETYPNITNYFGNGTLGAYEEVLKFDLVVNSDIDAKYNGSIAKDFYALNDDYKAEIVTMAINKTDSTVLMNTEENIDIVENEIFYSLNRNIDHNISMPCEMYEIDGKTFFIEGDINNTGDTESFITFTIARFEDGYVSLIIYSVDEKQYDEEILFDMLENYSVN